MLYTPPLSGFPQDADSVVLAAGHRGGKQSYEESTLDNIVVCIVLYI